MFSLKASSPVSPIPKALFLHGPFKQPSQLQAAEASQKNLDPSLPPLRPTSRIFLGPYMLIFQDPGILGGSIWPYGDSVGLCFCSLSFSSPECGGTECVRGN